MNSGYGLLGAFVFLVAGVILQALLQQFVYPLLSEYHERAKAAGRQSEARKILRRLEDRSERAFVPAYNLAIIHIALNEEEVAMRYMRQAFEDHDWALVVLTVEPRVDPMRRDPRFQEILAKLNLQ